MQSWIPSTPPPTLGQDGKQLAVAGPPVRALPRLTQHDWPRGQLAALEQLSEIGPEHGCPIGVQLSAIPPPRPPSAEMQQIAIAAGHIAPPQTKVPPGPPLDELLPPTPLEELTPLPEPTPLEELAPLLPTPLDDAVPLLPPTPLDELAPLLPMPPDELALPLPPTPLDELTPLLPAIPPDELAPPLLPTPPEDPAPLLPGPPSFWVGSPIDSRGDRAPQENTHAIANAVSAEPTSMPLAIIFP